MKCSLRAWSRSSKMSSCWLGIVAIMLNMNWKLALITFAVLPLIVWATMIFRDKVRDSYRRIRTAIARINSYLQEAVSGMLVLQLVQSRKARLPSSFPTVNAQHMDAFKDAIMAYAVYYPVVEILSPWRSLHHLVRRHGSCNICRGQLHFVVLSPGPHGMTIGILVAFMQYAQRFFRPIQDLSDKYNILQSAMASSERVFKLLDTPVDIESPRCHKKPRGPGPHRVRPRLVRLRAREPRQPMHVSTDKALRFAKSPGDSRRSRRPRLGAARCFFHDRTGRNGSDRRPHWSRQDHDHLAADAFLRCAEGRDPDRRRRHPGNGSA